MYNKNSLKIGNTVQGFKELYHKLVLFTNIKYLIKLYGRVKYGQKKQNYW